MSKAIHHELKQTLGTWHVRGIAVGLVLASGVADIAAIYCDELIQFGRQTLTAIIVTMSVFGAIVMEITSMLSLFKLRCTQRDLERPFRASVFPVFALIAAMEHPI